MHKKRDRGRDSILRDGLDGSAIVLVNRGDVGRHTEESDDFLSAVVDKLVTKNARYDYVLQIQVGDGRPAYELTGSWLIPNFSRGRDWIGMVQRGMTVPVKVLANDPERVAIDWDAFEADGGEQLVAEAWERSHEDTPDEEDDTPPMSASPRETAEWQLKKGYLDQATFDAIIAANPDLK